MIRLSAARATLAAALVLGASTARAQVASHTDGTMAGWTSTQMSNPLGCSSVGGAQQATGGNSGSQYVFQQFTCDYTYNAHFSTFSWNPLTQGAITGGLSIKWDANSHTGDIGFGSALRQGGKMFVTADYFIAHQADGWTAGGGGLTTNPGDYCEIFQLFGPYNGYVCGGATIDFLTGGTIDFGVSTANSGGFYGTEGAIDNFQVEFTHGPGTDVVPEPASLLLVATGLAGLGVVARRKQA